MLTVFISFVAFALVCMTGFAFGETTSAIANSGGYTSIPEAVRDFYSREVLFQAQPRLRFAQFAKVKRDLQAIRGKSIVFVKYNNLTGGGSLEEDDVLTPEAMSTAEVVVPVKEQGNSTQVTEYLLRTSLLDVLGDASRLLANNMAVVLDGQFRDTVLQTTNVIYGNGKKSLATLTATDYFNTVTVKDAVEILATNNAPRINGDFYVCIAHPHQLRTLRDDKEWIEANMAWLQSSMKRKKDYYRKYRDLCIISMIGVYFVAMIEAYVDAHLYNFDISDNLSMKVTPTVIEPVRYSTASIGFQCAITF